MSYTFCSVSFINPEVIQSKNKEMSIDVDEVFGSLSIDMVKAEESKAWGT